MNIAGLTEAGTRMRQHVERRWPELEEEGLTPDQIINKLLREVVAMNEPNILSHPPHPLTAKNRRDIEMIMEAHKKDTGMLWWNARQGKGYWRWIADRKRHVDKMSKRRTREKQRALRAAAKSEAGE